MEDVRGHDSDRGGVLVESAGRVLIQKAFCSRAAKELYIHRIQLSKANERNSRANQSKNHFSDIHYSIKRGKVFRR